jgi:hypothetical protein
MDHELLKTLGQVLGIGGLALGIPFLLSREAIRKSICGRLKEEDAYRLVRFINVSIWSVMVIGIAAWFWGNRNAGLIAKAPPQNVSVTTGPQSPIITDTEGDVRINFDPQLEAQKKLREEQRREQEQQRRQQQQEQERQQRELGRMRALGNQLAELPKGNIVLHAPATMKVTERRKVDASVGINVAMDVLRQQVPSGDQTFEGAPHISAEMVATLTGSAFKIDRITAEKQKIAEGFPTVWSWYIEAKDDGDQELEAVLYALVGDAQQRVDSYTQKICPRDEVG